MLTHYYEVLSRAVGPRFCDDFDYDEGGFSTLEEAQAYVDKEVQDSIARKSDVRVEYIITEVQMIEGKSYAPAFAYEVSDFDLAELE